jgi:hypothetical protein
MRLVARLRETEAEVDHLRLEISALENSAAQTEKAIDSLLVATRSGKRSMSLGNGLKIEDDNSYRSRGNSSKDDHYNDGGRPYRRDNPISYLSQSRSSIPSVNNRYEPISNRFSDRTITQACTLLLRESGGPLHVNELYNLLVSGGMKFKGNNPTISVAVSLSRNGRFKKVGPGTFDLVIREANRAAS